MKELDLKEFEGIENGAMVDYHEKAYTPVPNHIITDKRLSATAKHVMNYALMRAGIPGWDIRKSDIIEHGTEKRTAIDNAFNLLIETGYLVQSEIYKDPVTGHSKRKYKFYKDPENNPYYDGELPNNKFHSLKINRKKSPHLPGEQEGGINKTSTNTIPHKTNKANKNNTIYKDTVGEFEPID